MGYYPEVLEEDFIDAAYRLGIAEDIIMDVLDMIDYPSMDIVVNQKLTGDERMEQFVILGFNRCVREYGWDCDEMELSFSESDDYLDVPYDYCDIATTF